MKKNCLIDLCRVIALKLKKHGFTLAEALIITVMTGACLLPILGTMQNAQVRTETFDHESKMQQYARSRLNAEIANAAFDHKSINIDDEYHYIAYFDKDGNEDNAKLTEFPKTNVTPEEIASLSSLELASEWSEDSMDFLGIDETSQHYLRLVHAYKTSVESKNNPELAEHGNDSNLIDSPKGLLGIVVKTCLIKSNDNYYDTSDGALIIDYNDDGSIKTTDKDSSVPPVTLFSFVNLPTVSDEMIWLADALNCVIYGIDPMSRGVTTIPLPRSANQADKPDNTNNDPYRPWHIAAHPELKLLAVMMQEKIVLINIDKKSPFKYKIKNTIITKTNLGNDICKIDKDYNRAYEDGGMCFRPDGKVLFFTQTINKDNSKIYAYELKSLINQTTNILSWVDGDNNTPCFTNLTAGGLFRSLKDDKIADIKPSSDGYLYVGYKDIPSNKNPHGKAGCMIYRYPMYPSDWSDWDGEEFAFLEGKKFLSINVSPDGSRLAAITEAEGQLIEYDTKSKAQIYNPLTIKNAEKMPTPFKNTYVAVSDKNTHLTSEKGLSVAVTSKTDVKKSLIGNFESSSSTPFRKAKAADGKEGGFVVVSPDGRSIVANDKKKPWIYFWNAGTTNSEDSLTLDNNGISEFLLDTNSKKDKGYSDLTTTKRDILAAALGNNDIKLYDLNTLKELEDDGYIATYSFSDLAMNNLGNALISSHEDNTTGCYVYNFTDGLTKNPTVNTYRRKAVFDDNYPNMAFVLQYAKDGAGNIKNEGFCNLYYSVVDRWETSSTDSYDRRNFTISPEWRGLDIIGMPNGGALVLYGKITDTGSLEGSSMLEWIGRRNWGSSNVGKYKLFARWISNKNNVSSKTVPNYSLDTTLSQVDSWQGRVFVVHSQTFPVNSVIKTCSGYAGDTIPNDETRYITPLIVEYIDSNYNIKIIDWADSIGFSKGETKEDYELSWLNGGKILNDNCRVGFYSGSFAGPNQGAIAYEEVTDGDYLADYYSENITGVDYGEALAGAATFNEITNLTTKFLRYPNVDSTETSKYRKYALIFKSVDEKADSFPPLYSKRLAISPDCGTLAILSTRNNGTTNADKIPVLRLFDFNNYIYGAETQLEGFLVDYREGCNGDSNWPKEKDSVFKRVSDETRFQYCSSSDELHNITSFPNATTKFESWNSFREHPANYYVRLGSYVEHTEGDFLNENKQYSNKRFFGYFRPESDVNYLQSCSSKDIRFFFNGKFLVGRKDNSGGSNNFNAFSIPVTFPVKAYNSVLYQQDEAYGTAGSLGSNVFVASDKSNFDGFMSSIEKKTPNSNPLDNYFNILPSKSFDYINSAQTYILKNHPSYINSYKVQTDTGSGINMNYANMVFSRDRAKPVLYIKGENKLFVLYYDKLLMLIPGSGTNSKNVVISSDGQKLIFGKGTNIKIYNIAKPDENSFEDESLSITTNKDNYLGEIATIDAKSSPLYLAEKPFTSYNSAKIGGECKEMVLVSGSFPILTNSAAVVASGGIYLLGSSGKEIGVYNPMIDKKRILTLSEGLVKNSQSAAVTAYDDTLYFFGGSGSSGSNMVQNFNVNTKEAMYSFLPQGFSDEYLVNLALTDRDASNFNGETNFENYYKSYNIGNPSHGLFYNDNDWAYTRRSGNFDNPPGVACIDFNINECPLTINKIILSNKHNDRTDANLLDDGLVGYEGGLRGFTLRGSFDNSNWDYICSGNLGSTHSNFGPSSFYRQFFEDENYKFYRFILDTNSNGAVRGQVALDGSTGFNEADLTLLQYWRTGVKRLIPEIGSMSSVPTNQNYINWNSPTSDVNTSMTWSTTSSDAASYEYHLGDVYKQNSIQNNIISGIEGWESSIAKPWIKVELSEGEVATVVRYSNSSNVNYLKEFKIYGSKSTGSLRTPGQTGWESDWEILTFSDSQQKFSGPKVYGTYITTELKNQNKYWQYLFVVTDYDGSKVRLNGFEMFSSNISGEDTLTPMKTDDLTDVAVSNAAVCATPYGLVVTGGYNGSTPKKTALLYWPHAVNKFDGRHTQYGIPRSLPDMNVSRAGHCLVWHKGKIYAIGGQKDSHNCCAGDDYIEYLDYNNKMEWQSIPNNSYNYIGNYSFSTFQDRINLGACSFGDEIFIFDGTDGTDTSKGRCSALAWNPETNVVRQINDTIDHNGAQLRLAPCTAVSFGSKIYVYGKNTSDNKYYMLEYTP